MSKIFISHASENNAEALALEQWLKSEGWDDYFLDFSPEEGILPGEQWLEALRKASHRCEAIICLISHEWLSKSWCDTEYKLAQMLNKIVFGICIESIPSEDIPAGMKAIWQITNLTNGEAKQTFSVALDGVVPTTEVEFTQTGLDRLKHGLIKASIGANYFAWPPQNEPGRPPYRGLEALSEKDAAIYFGRDSAILDGLDKLRGMRKMAVSRILSINGASGSGKSSFLKAGLWPRLKRDDQNFYPLPIIRPETDVIEGKSGGLLEALTSTVKTLGLSFSKAAIRKKLKTGNGLFELLTQIQNKHFEQMLDINTPATILIGIDQAEELFDSNEEAARNQFLALVANVIKQDDGKSPPLLILIPTIRSDSFAELQNAKQLQKLKQEEYTLSPVSISDYKEIILGPAKRSTESGNKLEIEPSLVDALLNDAIGADALPLLAFTLEKLYEDYYSQSGEDEEEEEDKKEEAGKLKLNDYVDFGGMSGAIKVTIDTAHQQSGLKLTETVRNKALENIFIPALTSINTASGEARRNIASYSKLTKQHQNLSPLIDALIEQRVLTKHEDSLEVSHEAILRQWDVMKDAIDKEKDNLKLLESIQAATNEWQQNNKDAEWLTHQGSRLEDAIKLSKDQRYQLALQQDNCQHYLDACQAKQQDAITAKLNEIKQREEAQSKAAEALQATKLAQERTKKLQKRALWGLALVAMAIIGGTIYTLQQQKEVKLIINKARMAEALNASQNHHDTTAVKLGLLIANSNLSVKNNSYFENGLSNILFKNRHLMTLSKHGHWINSASYSPDSTKIVTISDDGIAKIWDASTGVERATLQHQYEVNSASFSPDGKTIVTHSGDIAKIWDANSGEEIASLQHENHVNDVSFSPDGKTIVTRSYERTAKIWDVRTGAKLITLQHQGQVKDVSFSPDGKTVVTGSDDKTAKVWNANTGAELFTLQHKNDVNSVIFSPYGKTIFTLSNNRSAKIWDANTGIEIATLQNENYVNDVSFSPDGKTLVAGSNDKTAKIWDVRTGEKLVTLQHQDEVNDVIFSPDSKTIITYSSDNKETMGYATMWDATTGAALATLQHNARIREVNFSPDGKTIITGALDNTAKLWDASTGAELATLLHQDGVKGANFSSDGKTIITYTYDNTLTVWDANKDAKITTSKLLSEILGASFSPDGKNIVTTSNDYFAKLWDASTGAEIATLQHENHVNDVSFSPDGKNIVTRSYDRTAKIWDANTGTEIATLQHKDVVNSVMFSPDGETIVTSCSDFAKLWDASTGAEIATLQHQGEVNDASFSPDGKTIVTRSDDKTAKLWDAKTGVEVAVLQHNFRVQSVSFSPNGRAIVTSFHSSTAKLWDARTGAEIAALQHLAKINDVTFSPDGKAIVTSSLDSTARMWDASTGAELATFRHEREVIDASFSSNGRVIVTRNDNKTAKVWNVYTGALITTLQHLSSVSSVSFSHDGKTIVTGSKDKTVKLWSANNGFEIVTLQHQNPVTIATLSPDGKTIATSTFLGEKVNIWDLNKLLIAQRKDRTKFICQHYLVGQETINKSDLAASVTLRTFYKEGDSVCE